MTISTNIPNLEKLFKHYYNLLTIKDIMIINQILIGCTKIAYSKHELNKYTKTTPKKILVGVFLLKELTRSDSYSSLPDKFRSLNVKQKLNEETKNIDPTDISDLFKIFSKVKIIEKVPTNNNDNQNRRGKPSQRTDPRIHGPKKYWEESEYLKKLKQVIMNPIVRYLIFFYLFESNVIQLYIYKTCLFVLNDIKRILGKEPINLKNGRTISLTKNKIEELARNMMQQQLSKRN